MSSQESVRLTGIIRENQIDFLYDQRQASTYAEKTYLFAQVPSITYNFKFKP